MALNTAKWGLQKARERYGDLGKPSMKAADQHEPQFREDKHGPDYDNDVKDNWVRGSPNESAEGKPSFDKSSGSAGHGGKSGEGPR